MARMTRRLGTLATALAVAAGAIGLATPAEAKPPAKCKYISGTLFEQQGGPTTITKVERCRGKLVVTTYVFL